MPLLERSNWIYLHFRETRSLARSPQHRRFLFSPHLLSTFRRFHIAATRLVISFPPSAGVSTSEGRPMAFQRRCEGTDDGSTTRRRNVVRFRLVKHFYRAASISPCMSTAKFARSDLSARRRESPAEMARMKKKNRRIFCSAPAQCRQCTDVLLSTCSLLLHTCSTFDFFLAVVAPCLRRAPPQLLSLSFLTNNAAHSLS
jgi:hypothetical protein